jgi:hypothetical protein
MAYKIADSYRNMQIYDKANEWYGTCIELKYFDAVPEVYFYRGDMQRMLKEYDNILVKASNGVLLWKLFDEFFI